MTEFRTASAMSLSPESLPQHVAVIMDGNGRWATQRGLPRFEGHRRGVEAVRRTVRAAQEIGLRYLTIYSFSSENWSRPVDEVAGLMSLLRFYIRNDLSELRANNVRVRIVGARDDLPADLTPLLDEAERTTAQNTGLTLMVAFNYGGRQEILAAVQRLAASAVAGRIAPEAIDVATFEKELATAGAPDPDLVIRTSGEQRVSNFLLWQAAYAEFVFTPVLWPDFDKAALEAAIVEYAQRERRYGGVEAVKKMTAS